MPQTPAAEELPLRSRRKRPRNYLVRSEQRRVFWLFMPPAMVVLLLLGWIERTWQASPPAADRPQVDTTVMEVPADPAVADAVMIEAEPTLPAAAADECGATSEALARVRDDSMFRATDEEAWFQIWMTLRSSEMKSLLNSPARRVSFGELYGQPLTFRGRLVRFRGPLHRLEKMSAPPNQYDIRDYWQGWLEPEGGPASPIVVYFLRLPARMPTGMKIDESVEVVGYFFKRWAYAATDTIRIAPLVMALEPAWKPRPAAAPQSNSISTVALVTIAAVVLLTLLGIRAADRAPARPHEQPPTDLSAALSNVEIFSTEESLRRLADSEHSPTQSPAKEPT